LGSSRLASTPSRTPYSSTAYAPFGETYATAGTGDQNFTGMNSDTVSTLYDFPARRLSPWMGRWISPDPSGTNAVDPTSPQTWNRYAYVSNNPLSFVDPLGLDQDMFYCAVMAYLGYPCPSGGGGGGGGGGDDGGGGGIGSLNLGGGGSSWSGVGWGPGGFGGVPGNSALNVSYNPAPSNLTPANPCLSAGRAPSPSTYAKAGQAGSTNAVRDFLNLYSFRRGAALDAQVRYGGSPAYANYVFGVYMSAAGNTLNQTLAAADMYAQYRSSYPVGTPMAGPNYPFTPQANVTNITNGFNAQTNGTTCKIP